MSPEALTDPLVPNTALTLDAIPAPRAAWERVRRFARTFDAPGYHGSVGNCLDAAEGTRQRWARDGVARIGLFQLRSALFVCALEGDAANGDGDDDRFARAVVEEIRRRVAAGLVSRDEEESFFETYDLDARFPDRRQLSDTVATAERESGWFAIFTDRSIADQMESVLNARMRTVRVERFATREARDDHPAVRPLVTAPPRPAPAEPEPAGAPIEFRGDNIEDWIDALWPPNVRMIAPDGHEITSVEEWRQHAPPKSPERQWKDGRSAKELAKAWRRRRIPDDLDRFLSRHPATAGFEADVAYPEHCTALDTFGEPRNHDLVVVGAVGNVRTMIGIEAKADEAFGTLPIGAYRQQEQVKNETRKADGKRLSRVPERIDALCRAVFGATLEDAGAEHTPIAALRYQLLTALAGTAIEADQREAHRAVLVINEFVSAQHTSPRKLAANASHLRAFVKALPGVYDTVMPPADASNWLLGPFKLPGHGAVPSDLPMYVGKLRTRVDSTG